MLKPPLTVPVKELTIGVPDIKIDKTRAILVPASTGIFKEAFAEAVSPMDIIPVSVGVKFTVLPGINVNELDAGFEEYNCATILILLPTRANPNAVEKNTLNSFITPSLGAIKVKSLKPCRLMEGPNIGRGILSPNPIRAGNPGSPLIRDVKLTGPPDA
jgi:hypothetical protein